MVTIKLTLFFSVLCFLIGATLVQTIHLEKKKTPPYDYPTMEDYNDMRSELERLRKIVSEQSDTTKHNN